jgi:hypothetical protein
MTTNLSSIFTVYPASSNSEEAPILFSDDQYWLDVNTQMNVKPASYPNINDRNITITNETYQPLYIDLGAEVSFSYQFEIRTEAWPIIFVNKNNGSKIIFKANSTINFRQNWSDATVTFNVQVLLENTDKTMITANGDHLKFNNNFTALGNVEFSDFGIAPKTIIFNGPVNISGYLTSYLYKIVISLDTEFTCGELLNPTYIEYSISAAGEFNKS